jgi:hypothetical protein
LKVSPSDGEFNFTSNRTNQKAKIGPETNISKEYWLEGVEIPVFRRETPLLVDDPAVETITIQCKI